MRPLQAPLAEEQAGAASFFLRRFMNAIRITFIFLRASIFLVVLSLGLEAKLADTIWLARRPRLFLRSLLAMNVIMPLVAVALAWTSWLNPAVKIALVFLAASPVPPVLPRKQSKLGGSSDYIHGLLFSAALLSIVIVPLTIKLVARLFGQDVHVGPGEVAKIVATSVLLPFAAGIILRRIAPGLAQRIAQPLSGIAFLILVAAAGALLVAALPGMLALIGNGTVLAIVIFVVIGVVVGHLLGGPDPGERTVLALATASRHPGVAIVLATANYPDRARTVAAAILLYMLVSGVVLVPYSSWRRHRLRSSQLGDSPPEQRAA